MIINRIQLLCIVRTVYLFKVIVKCVQQQMRQSGFMDDQKGLLILIKMMKHLRKTAGQRKLQRLPRVSIKFIDNFAEYILNNRFFRCKIAVISGTIHPRLRGNLLNRDLRIGLFLHKVQQGL